jgi:hypothetical protein
MMEKQKYLLSINSNPPGASVFLNEQKIGKTPFREKVEYGSYKASVRFNGYITEESDIWINKNIAMNFTLKKIEFIPFRVTSTPSGASVFFGSKERGKTPETFQLPEGDYLIEVELNGKRENSFISLKKSKDIKIISFDLKKDSELDSSIRTPDKDTVCENPNKVLYYRHGKYGTKDVRAVNCEDPNKINYNYLWFAFVPFYSSGFHALNKFYIPEENIVAWFPSTIFIGMKTGGFIAIINSPYIVAGSVFLGIGISLDLIFSYIIFFEIEGNKEYVNIQKEFSLNIGFRPRIIYSTIFSPLQNKERRIDGLEITINKKF